MIRLTEVNKAAAAFASGGRLITIEPDGERLVFLIDHPAGDSFLTQLAAGQICGPYRDFIASLNVAWDLVHAHRRSRR